MKTKGKQKAKLFLSAFLAVLFSLLCFMPLMGGGRTASYASSSPRLYYFTDNQSSQDYINFIENDLQNTYPNITRVETIVVPYGEMDNLVINNSDIFDVSNAYVIFELTSFEYANIDIDTILSNSLESLFQKLKYNGCHIMFICGTEEERTSPYTGFLDYVDIHINTDVFSIFVDSLFYQIEQDCDDERISNVNFLLDPSLSQDWFFNYWFIPYFRDRYDLSARDYPYDTVINELNEYHRINIFTTEDGENYTQIISGEHYNYEDAYFIDILQENNTYAIGATFTDETIFDDWTDSLCLLEMAYIVRLKTFIYNDNNTVINSNLNNIYSAGDALYDYNNFLCYDILTDFVGNNDLSVYQNWPGRCVITHKTINMGEDGWILSCRELPCWQIYMDDETAAFYGR